MEEASQIKITLLLIAAIFTPILWRGLVKFFNRHNKLLVILYIVLLFPIAFFHILIIGFGFTKATPSPKKIKMSRAQKKQEWESRQREKRHQKRLKKEKEEARKEQIRRDMITDDDMYGGFD